MDPVIQFYWGLRRTPQQILQMQIFMVNSNNFPPLDFTIINANHSCPDLGAVEYSLGIIRHLKHKAMMITLKYIHYQIKMPISSASLGMILQTLLVHLPIGGRGLMTSLHQTWFIHKNKTSTCWNSISVYQMVRSLFQCRYQLTNIPPPPQLPTSTPTPYYLHIANSSISEAAFYIGYIAPIPMFPYFHWWSGLQPIHQAITLWFSGPFQPYTTQHNIHQAPSLGNLNLKLKTS